MLTAFRSDENILRTNFPLGDRLNVNFSDDPNQSSTAIFQIGSAETFDLPLYCAPQTSLHFQAAYFHNGKYHIHPYPFHIFINSTAVANNIICAADQEIRGILSMFLCLKRLRDFFLDDFKRYLDAVNDTLESGKPSEDFHQFFIFITKTETNQRISMCCCNQFQPLHLPTIISHRHTLKNTMIRERYKGERRVEKIQCEFKLIDSNPQMKQFRLALFPVRNKYPLSTNNCRLNLTYELEKNCSRNNDSSTVAKRNNKQCSWNHPAGMVIVDIYGPNLEFLPRMIGSNNMPDYVRLVNIPDEWKNKLRSSRFVPNSMVDVSMMNKKEYSVVHQKRQEDPITKPYTSSVGNIDASENSRTTVQSTPNDRREDAQLVVNDNTLKKTFSERHLRILACGLSQNDVLFVEAIFPPLRDTKRFPPLEIQKILAETNELRAEIRHWIYCEQDVLKSKSSFTQSPFGLDFFFMRPGERLTKTELATFSRLADLHVETSYEPCCPHLLSFQMPDRPEFDGLEFYVRLHHMRSFDYNTSDLFRDETVTTYRSKSVPMRKNNSNSADFNEIDEDLLSLLQSTDPVMPVDQMTLGLNTDDFCYVSNTPLFLSNGY